MLSVAKHLKPKSEILPSPKAGSERQEFGGLKQNILECPAFGGTFGQPTHRTWIRLRLKG
jgi:hypothetical protein